MQQALEEIRTLLDSYGLATYVELFDEVLRHYIAGEDVQFREALLSNSVGGGAGSVCDMNLPYLHQEGRDGWQDQKSLDLAIVRLAEALDASWSSRRTRPGEWKANEKRTVAESVMTSRERLGSPKALR